MKTKVLYVEDEEILANLVRDHLERQGFEVTWCVDGKIAPATWLSCKPDLCILDVMLPGMNGFEVGRAIRKEAPQVPIIFLTAKSETKDVVEGFASGGNDYLRKPFSLEELMARIHNLLSMSGRTAPGVVRIGKLEFDPVRMVLKQDDEVVILSHRENELMKMLTEKMGSRVDRKEILLQLWGDDHFFNSRNLDVYITRLRKHLKMDPDINLITLKGVGYQMVVNG